MNAFARFPQLAAAGLPFVCTVERRPAEEVPLCEGGGDVVVTAANREVFVARKVVTQLVTPVEIGFDPLDNLLYRCQEDAVVSNQVLSFHGFSFHKFFEVLICLDASRLHMHGEHGRSKLDDTTQVRGLLLRAPVGASAALTNRLFLVLLF